MMIKEEHENIERQENCRKIIERGKGFGTRRGIKCQKVRNLKGIAYYESVDEARPLSGFVPTHADFFTEMHF